MNDRFNLNAIDPVQTLVPPDAKPQELAPQVNFLGDVQRLALKPGDMLVLRTDQIISGDLAQRLREQLESAVPGHSVIVLGDGMKLGVLSPERVVTTSYAMGGYVASGVASLSTAPGIVHGAQEDAA